MFCFLLNKFVVVIIVNQDISLGTKNSFNINYSVYGTTVLTNNDFLFIVIVQIAPNEIFGLIK